MKKKNKKSKRLVLFISVALIIIVIFVGWILWSQKSPSPNPPNVKTLSQGTQMRYNEISIALANVDKNSGWIYIHKNGEVESIKKQVFAGDKVEAYGYTIEIKSVKSVANSSTKSGASNGYITFVIDKQ